MVEAVLGFLTTIAGLFATIYGALQASKSSDTPPDSPPSRNDDWVV